LFSIRKIAIQSIPFIGFSENINAIISLQPAIKFNGGGHINHSIFWKVLSPNGGGAPTGDLKDAIKVHATGFIKL